MTDKKNGIHLRWGAIGVVLGLLGFAIGTFINPLQEGISKNTDNIQEVKEVQMVFEATQTQWNVGVKEDLGELKTGIQEIKTLLMDQ